MDAKMLPHFMLNLTGRNAANAIERDWEGMLPELVCTIARKVTDISDFIRFRAICKKWRSVTTIADMAPQFPWLLNHSIGPNLLFYSIALDKTFSIHAPKFLNKEYFNPCHGLMLVHSSLSKLHWSLINPLNNNEISLPSTGDFFYEWIGSRSCQNMDYVVVEGYNPLHVFKLGDDKWIHMERKDCETYFHFKNLLFIVDELSRFTKVIDLRTHKTVFVVPPPHNTWMLYINEELFWSKFWRYPTLIESYGDILLVTFAYELKKIVIHRLEVGNGQGILIGSRSKASVTVYCLSTLKKIVVIFLLKLVICMGST
ncbi:F-box domain-containing protein [Rhynchospora pubera]|uniref:F-box domain-containing protein n=1 Tax=Rhynchospora pubera TaxID=906938 RepID=A0AAV8DS92_9POAL|nr:F-box domain-containing protein [Rhynchospora pubera]